MLILHITLPALNPDRMLIKIKFKVAHALRYLF